MEVGAVKQAFNNEVILLKKRLNQARTQTIHKLTRKAKVLVEKKCPEPLKEKLKRKAEAAINEVLILKKIKAKDIAKFAVIHKGNLSDYLNKPQVDESKACARLLLHKVLQDKYKLLRTRFADMPIEDLLMSRQERKKLKKESKDKQNKKKNNNNKLNNSEGEWNILDIMDKSKEVDESVDSTDNEIQASDVESGTSEPEIEADQIENVKTRTESRVRDSSDEESDKIENVKTRIKGRFHDSSDEESATDNITNEEVGRFVKINHEQKEETNSLKNNRVNESLLQNNQQTNKIKVKGNDKLKNSNRSKNLNEKISLRKFKKSQETPVQDNKVVDPFFITATGENYMSVVEPRLPDEFKEIHKQGNRKIRRAALFGHVPKLKQRHNHFDRESAFQKNDFSFNNKYNNSKEANFCGSNSKDKSDFKQRNNDQNESKEEKLHPSWEAKKRQSTILPFQGKKVVFDDG